MSASPRQRNLRGHGVLLREEILSAAARVIDHADSVGEVSLRRIAREAGIAAPSVYAHFEDRDRVLEAVVESSWMQVCEEIAEAVQSVVDPRERLLIGCRAYVSFAQRHPLRYVLMAQVAHTPPAARQALESATRGLSACRAGAPDGVLDRVAAALSVALHGVAMLNRVDAPNLWLSDFSTDEVIQTVVDAATVLLADAAPA